MGKLFLVDDGTLDTVLECEACGMQERYASDRFERAEDGSLVDEEATCQEASSEHECEDIA